MSGRTILNSRCSKTGSTSILRLYLWVKILHLAHQKFTIIKCAMYCIIHFSKVGYKLEKKKKAQTLENVFFETKLGKDGEVRFVL